MTFIGLKHQGAIGRRIGRGQSSVVQGHGGRAHVNQVSSIASDAWKSRRLTLEFETDPAAGRPCRLTDTFAVCNFLFASSPKIVVIIPGAQGQNPAPMTVMGPQTPQSQPIGSTLALTPRRRPFPSLTLEPKVRFQLATRYANVSSKGRAISLVNEPANPFLYAIRALPRSPVIPQRSPARLHVRSWHEPESPRRALSLNLDVHPALLMPCLTGLLLCAPVCS